MDSQTTQQDSAADSPMEQEDSAAGSQTANKQGGRDSCPSCFGTLEDVPHEGTVCPHCGYDYSDDTQANLANRGLKRPE